MHTIRDRVWETQIFMTQKFNLINPRRRKTNEQEENKFNIAWINPWIHAALTKSWNSDINWIIKISPKFLDRMIDD